MGRKPETIDVSNGGVWRVAFAIAFFFGVTHFAAGAPIAIRADGYVDLATGSTCTPYDTGFCSFGGIIPDPHFLATYPHGLPLTLTYTVDSTAPNTSGDPNAGVFQAIQSAIVDVGPGPNRLDSGTVSLSVTPGAGGVVDSARFEIVQPPPPLFVYGAASRLVWVISGYDIFQTGAVPLVPGPGWTAGGALSFGEQFITFNLTSFREIPEPSTAALLVIGCVVALVVRRW